MLVAMLLAPSLLAESYWVGYGSFRGLTNAERSKAELSKSTLRQLSIRSVSTNRGEFFRLVAGPFESISAARAAVARARRMGHEHAWLVIEPDGPVRVQLAQQGVAAPLNGAPRAVAEPPTPVMVPMPPAAAGSGALPDESAQPSAPLPQAPQSIAVAVRPGESIPLTRIDATATPIKIDGHLNEPIWRTIPVIDDFVVLEPDTLQPGEHPTRLMLAYSDQGLYVAGDLEQPVETLVRRLSGRDVRDNRDSVSVTIDTSGEGRYGFWFGVNLGDSLMDGTVLPERTFSNEWDGPWYGRSQQTERGWTVEMFIPWGVVSMPAASDVRSMGMYVSRKVAYKDERWGWPTLPSTQAVFMSGLAPIEMRGVQPRQQYNIYPFAATAYDQVDEEMRYRAGADLFWRPSSNFQMNATINPDFGNVESDDVVINLTATETFFPEKRLFFLEGQEIFVASPRADTRTNGVGNGGSPYTMVNTRRIGGKPRAPLVSDDVEVPDRELVQLTELAGAVKTTGQVGGFRYGVMGAFEEEVKFDVLDAGQPRNLHQEGNDYGIARLLYENNSGGSYKALGVLSTAVLHEDGDALTHGIDWHYFSPGGKVKIDGQAIMSDLDRVDDSGYGGFLDFEFTYRQGLKHRIGLEYFDENIDINDLGFLERNNHYRLRSALSWSTPNVAWGREFQFDVRGFMQKSVTESLLNGAGLFLSARMLMNDLSTITARGGYFPAQYDDLNSFGNGTYRIENKISASVQWESDSTKVWSYDLQAGYDDENLGGSSVTGGAGINWRPNDQFGVKFGVRYLDRQGWLLHQGDGLFATYDAEQWMPKMSIEYFISARQQLRLSVQWVGIRATEDRFFRVPDRPGDLVDAAKPAGPGARPDYNFSVSQYALQARYRWEIAPLSDIFLVYTRQADVRTLLGDNTFSDILDDAWHSPLEDIFVFKIRYRFGS